MGARRIHDGAYAQAMLGVPLHANERFSAGVGPLQPALDVLS